MTAHSPQRARRSAEPAGRRVSARPLLDRAVLDALCRAYGISFYDAVRANLPGLTRRAHARPRWVRPGPRSWQASTRWQLDRSPAYGRVGRSDHRGGPGRPGRRRAAGDAGGGRRDLRPPLVQAEGRRRCRRRPRPSRPIAAVLDRSPGYRVTLDGNEQYADAEAALALWRGIAAHPRLRRSGDSVAFIEQPIRRLGARRPGIARSRRSGRC